MSSASAIPDSNQMAIDRTWLAHERTLMAWVRTAVSMISFGFTIYKFFQYDLSKEAPIRHGHLTPRDFAMIMVTIGLGSLLAATFEHRSQTRSLRLALGNKRSLAQIIAYFVSVFGILVLISTLFRQ
jgi:putative membrane protein